MKFWTDQTFLDGILDFETEGNWQNRPKSTRTEVNIAAVADLVKNNRRIASRIIAECFNISKTLVLRILKEDLGKRKLCARFVPHSLTPEQREDRVTSCQDIIAMSQFFLTRLLWEIRPGVLPMTPKRSDRFLNGLVRHPLGRRKWNSKGPHQYNVGNFFWTLKA